MGSPRLWRGAKRAASGREKQQRRREGGGLPTEAIQCEGRGPPPTTAARSGGMGGSGQRWPPAGGAAGLSVAFPMARGLWGGAAASVGRSGGGPAGALPRPKPRRAGRGERRELRGCNKRHSKRKAPLDGLRPREEKCPAQWSWYVLDTKSLLWNLTSLGSWPAQLRRRRKLCDAPPSSSGSCTRLHPRRTAPHPPVRVTGFPPPLFARLPVGAALFPLFLCPAPPFALSSRSLGHHEGL